MKNYQKKVFKTLLICSIGFGAVAQVKIGSSPTTIDANANLQVQSTNGSQVIVTKDNGNLGVGTINPTDKLEVKGGGITLTPTGGGSATGFAPLKLQNIAAKTVFKIQQEIGADDGKIFFLTDEANNGATESARMAIQRSNGFVGIGTTAPSQKLTVENGFGLFKNPNSDFSLSYFESGQGVSMQVGSTTSNTVFGAGAVVGTLTQNPLNLIYNNLPKLRLTNTEFTPVGFFGTVSLGSDNERWNTLYTGGGGVDAKNVDSDFVFSKFESKGGVISQIGSSSPTSAFGSGAFMGTASNHALNFLVNNVPVTRLFGQSFEPNGSNLVQLGSDLNRWNTVYSGGGGFNAKNVSALYVVSSSECQGGVVSTAGVSAPTSAFGAAAIFGSFSNHQVLINANNAPVIRVLPNYLEPVFNNSVSLGSFTQRYTAVFADNGTIQTSDRRLKENIKPIAHGLSDVMKIEAVSYDWKNKSNEKTKLGFIAQDLQKILPELISGKESEDTYLAVNYAELTPVLVKAIQEQQAMIDALKLENKSLKTAVSQIETFKAEMASIKNLLTNTQSKEAGK